LVILYPNEIGSMSWGNTIPRMVTWVKFFDKKTNKQFYFMHLMDSKIIPMVVQIVEVDGIMTKDNVTTQKKKKNGQYPSDHLPVLSDLTLHY
jgi:endonuclease/exonuclease/phosphatase (EEP) superfamily protein YafD